MKGIYFCFLVSYSLILSCESQEVTTSISAIDNEVHTELIESEKDSSSGDETSKELDKDVPQMTTASDSLFVLYFPSCTVFSIDSFLLLPVQLEMLDYFNYPNEKHSVTTKDGYILEIHRIPNPGQPPIILSHGVLSSSADFLVMGPNQSLAFLLHDQKYDVWLFNYRGNRYSRKHVSLNPNFGAKFWQFSMHEIAVYDLAATVDYIVNETNHQRLYYSGHSMGTMIFWILLSEQPEYNDRFHFMQALAPVAFLGNLKSAILRNVVRTIDTLEVLFAMNGIFEMFAHDTIQRATFKDLCLATLSNVCFPVMEDVVGNGIGALNKTVLSRVFGHFPAGASLKLFSHTAQLVKSKKFAKYDFGPADNLRLYGTATPPSYNLKNCRVPVSLHYGTQDGIVALKDVDLLSQGLESVVEMNQIVGYNHLDFLYSFESTEGLYRPMLRTFNEHRKRVGV